MTEAKRRVIKIEEDGKLIKEFEDRRKYGDPLYYTNGHKLPFGLRPAEVIQIAGLFVAVVIFVFKTDQRIAVLEDGMKYLTSYAEASDGYHSAVTGTQFQGGKPINPNYDPARTRTMIGVTNESREKISN